MNGLMAGKKGLIMGLANDRSLAWGIAKALHSHGAQMAFSYQGESLEKRVRPLAAELGSDLLIAMWRIWPRSMRRSASWKRAGAD